MAAMQRPRQCAEKVCHGCEGPLGRRLQAFSVDPGNKFRSVEGPAHNPRLGSKVVGMGLFDALPPPAAQKDKGSAAKRPSVDRPPGEDSSGNKKARADGTSEQQVVPLACTPIAAAYSEDKGSRLTMEGERQAGSRAGGAALARLPALRAAPLAQAAMMLATPVDHDASKQDMSPVHDHCFVQT